MKKNNQETAVTGTFLPAVHLINQEAYLGGNYAPPLVELAETNAPFDRLRELVGEQLL